MNEQDAQVLMKHEFDLRKTLFHSDEYHTMMIVHLKDIAAKTNNKAAGTNQHYQYDYIRQRFPSKQDFMTFYNDNHERIQGVYKRLEADVEDYGRAAEHFVPVSLAYLKRFAKQRERAFLTREAYLQLRAQKVYDTTT